MNKQQKINEYRRIKGLFLNPYPEGCIKITSGEGFIHARVKTEVAHWFKCNGYEVYSEVNFKGLKGRADLFILNKNGYCFIFEIVCSEKEKSIQNKKDKYPQEIPLIFVDINKFNYKEFKF